MVLSACSTYFEQLFLEHPEPNPIVIMRETSYTDLAIIVEFMYKGEINVSQVRNLSHRRQHLASSRGNLRICAKFVTKREPQGHEFWKFDIEMFHWMSTSEELFTPKEGVRILNSKKNPWNFLEF